MPLLAVYRRFVVQSIIIQCITIHYSAGVTVQYSTREEPLYPAISIPTGSQVFPVVPGDSCLWCGRFMGQTINPAAAFFLLLLLLLLLLCR